MIMKKLVVGASAVALLAAPLQAASPAGALSLTNVREGSTLEGEGHIGGVAPIISILVSVLGAYLAYQAFDIGDLGSDDDDEEEPPVSA